MPKALPIELRSRVLASLAEGMTFVEAAETFDVGVATIVRWRRLERERGDARPRKTGGDRRSWRIEAASGAILALLEEDPELPINALRAALREQGLVFGYGTVRMFLKRHGFKRRRGRRPARRTPARPSRCKPVRIP
ncbi:MAG: hypothetical protein OXG99_05410 [Alphaproteobacteria bacterium]|nr:hypothetical protein [Alphaproteobacteria bacterium]